MVLEIVYKHKGGFKGWWSSRDLPQFKTDLEQQDELNILGFVFFQINMVASFLPHKTRIQTFVLTATCKRWRRCSP